MAVHRVDDLIKTFVCQNGENRSENFFLHYPVVPCYAVCHGHLDFSRFGIRFSAENDFFTVNKTEYPVKMLIVYYAAVIVIIQTIAELPFYFGFDKLNKPVLYALVNIHVVGRNARLTDIETFAEDESSCGKSEICRFIDNRRTFAAEFKRNGSQIFRRLFQNELTDRFTAGKENVIEFFFEKTAVFLSAAGYDFDEFFGKTVSSNFFTISVVCGEYALGLTIHVLPAAIASITGGNVSING